jgi:hypothetical protein
MTHQPKILLVRCLRLLDIAISRDVAWASMPMRGRPTERRASRGRPRGRPRDKVSVANSSTNPTEALKLNWLIQTRQNWLVERLIDKLIVHGGHVTIWPLQHES